MSRTTIDIDTPILDEIRRIHRDGNKSMGRIISDLLAEALANKRERKESATHFTWQARPLGARIDLEDKDALYRALEKGRPV